MRTTRVIPLRTAPGLAGWTALPERDRAVLLWLVGGDVITAELAALLAYGHRRIAQRRLARLVEYRLLSGSWAANSQRPRGRYAYALTKATRVGLERLIWPDGRPELRNGVQVTAPVIHQLATHDLLAAFLRAGGPGSDEGLAAWVPERACLRLFEGWLRPDAFAVVRAGERTIVMFIERDLGTERGGVLPEKVHRYRSAFSRSAEPPIHLGIVVDSARRAASLGRAIARTDHPHGPIRVWLAALDGLARDPLRATWTSPAGDHVGTVDLAPHWTGEPWPLLVPGCLAQPDGLEALDERVFEAIPALAPFAR
jgi:hypothetical protein